MTETSASASSGPRPRAGGRVIVFAGILALVIVVGTVGGALQVERGTHAAVSEELQRTLTDRETAATSAAARAEADAARLQPEIVRLKEGVADLEFRLAAAKAALTTATATATAKPPTNGRSDEDSTMRDAGSPTHDKRD